jgi:hypothetical protein
MFSYRNKPNKHAVAISISVSLSAWSVLRSIHPADALLSEIQNFRDCAASLSCTLPG